MTEAEVKTEAGTFTRDYNVIDVLDLIAQYCERIKECKGKTVAAIFGVTQAGKSTTINALAYGPLTVKKRVRDQVEYSCPRYVPVELQSKMGTGRTGCTKAPECFALGGLGDEVILLDTRGVFDDRYINEMIASSILTQIALDGAREVKLVFLQQSRSFFGGHVGMMPFSTMFGDFVKSDNINALFLFNNYTEAVDGVGGQKYVDIMDEFTEQMAQTKAERDKQVDEAIERIVKRILSVPKNPVAELSTKYSTRDIIDMMFGRKAAPASDHEQELLQDLNLLVADDDEYKEEIKKMLYIEAMNNAFRRSTPLPPERLIPTIDEVATRVAPPGVRPARTGAPNPRPGSPTRAGSPTRPGFPPEREPSPLGRRLSVLGGPCVGYIDPADADSIDGVREKIRKLPSASIGLLDFSRFSKQNQEFYDYFGLNAKRFTTLLESRYKTLQFTPFAVNQFYTQIKDFIRSCEHDLQELQEKGTAVERVLLKKYDSKRGEHIIQLTSKRTSLSIKISQIERQIDDIENGGYVQLGVPDEWDMRDYYPQHVVSQKQNFPFIWREENISPDTKRDPHSQSPQDYSVTFKAGSRWRKIFSLVCSKARTSGKVTFLALCKDIPENKEHLEELKSSLEELKAKHESVIAELEAKSKETQTSLTTVINTVIGNSRAIETVITEYNEFAQITKTLFSKYSAPRGDKPSILEMYYNVAQILYPEERRRQAPVIQGFISAYEAATGKVNTIPLSVDSVDKLDASLELKHLKRRFARDLNPPK